MGARYAWAVLAACTAVVCAACGSTSPASSTTTLSLNAYLVRGHEETGMQPTGAATVYQTAAQWTSTGVPNRAVVNKRLEKEGFREVASVNTASAGGHQGISWVMELGSASAAAREEAAELQDFLHGSATGGGPVTRFTVSGVPHSDGFAYPPTAANVVFVEGRCVLLAGDALGGRDEPPVAAAARAVWTRTHGKSGACAA